MNILKKSGWSPWIGLSILALSLGVLLAISPMWSGDVHADGIGPLDVDPNFDLDVHVALNTGSNGIDVSWVSDVEEAGYVEWALSAGDLTGKTGTYTTTSDIRIVGYPGSDPKTYPEFANKKTHLVRVSGIANSTATVHFNIVSGSDVSGPHQRTLPGGALLSPGPAAVGNLTLSDGSAGTECLVYVRTTRVFFGDNNSLFAHFLSDGNGQFSLDLANLRQDTTNPAFFDINSALAVVANNPDFTISLQAQCDTSNSGSLTFTTQEANQAGNEVGGNYLNSDIALTTQVTEAVPLVVGQNLIGLPVAPAGGLTASGLAGEVTAQGGSVVTLTGWNDGTQSYDMWSSAAPGTNDFALQVGAAYFALVDVAPANDEVELTGVPITASVPLTLVVGLNMVSLPFMAQAYDSASLAQAIANAGGAAQQVIGWDTAAQNWDLWTISSPDANVMAVGNRTGYFVLVTQATPQPFQP